MQTKFAHILACLRLLGLTSSPVLHVIFMQILTYFPLPSSVPAFTGKLCSGFVRSLLHFNWYSFTCTPALWEGWSRSSVRNCISQCPVDNCLLKTKKQNLLSSGFPLSCTTFRSIFSFVHFLYFPQFPLVSVQTKSSSATSRAFAVCKRTSVRVFFLFAEVCNPCSLFGGSWLKGLRTDLNRQLLEGIAAAKLCKGMFLWQWKTISWPFTGKTEARPCNIVYRFR